METSESQTRRHHQRNRQISPEEPQVTQQRLTNRIRRLLASNRPKAKNTYTVSTGHTFQGTRQYHQTFRRDELVRKCITTNAYYATMTKGFETVLEGENPEDYEYVKQRIDSLNKKHNLDQVLYVAQINRSIHGVAAFEIVTGNAYPERLIPLRGDQLKPEIDSNTDQWHTTCPNNCNEPRTSLRPLLHIPYDKNLYAELNVERYELSKTGKLHFNHPEGTHDDMFWATALAIYAADNTTKTGKPVAKII